MYWYHRVREGFTMSGCWMEHGCGILTGASCLHFIIREQVSNSLTAMRVLYLGAANGTTVSHVADYVDVVYAVEFAPRPMQDLLEVCRRRRNIIPIMADAARPEQYAPLG